MGVGNTVKEFRNFIIKGNALDLAIGVAIGAAFSAVVTAIVSDFLTPLIAAIFGSPNFGNLHFTIHKSAIYYGLVINAIFTLVIVGAVIFFFIVKPISILKQRSGFEPPAPPSLSPCPSCFTAINPESKRCSACTESLAEGWATAS